MSVTREVREEVEELISRLSSDEISELLEHLREKFKRENEELRAIYTQEKCDG